MMQRVKAHPAQIAMVLERQREAEAAARRFADAVAVVVAGAGITAGHLQAIDTDSNEIVLDVTDAPETVP